MRRGREDLCSPPWPIRGTPQNPIRAHRALLPTWIEPDLTLLPPVLVQTSLRCVPRSKVSSFANSTSVHGC